jgi:hypothetical protein
MTMNRRKIGWWIMLAVVLVHAGGHVYRAYRHFGQTPAVTQQ